MDRAGLPAYCTLDDVHEPLPHTMAGGPFAAIAVTVVRKRVEACADNRSRIDRLTRGDRA